METYNTAHVDHAGLRMPSNAPLSRGRNLMPKRVAAFLALASLAVVITEAAAKPVVVGRLVSTKTAVERNCLIDGGHMTTEPSGQYSCVNSSTGLSTNCSSFGSCEIVCNGKECGGRARKPGAPAANSKSGTAEKPTSGGTTTAPLRRDPVGGTTTVRDHRGPVVVANPSKGPPPAAAPGTVGGKTTTTSTPGPVVRDDRP